MLERITIKYMNLVEKKYIIIIIIEKYLKNVKISFFDLVVYN